MEAHRVVVTANTVGRLSLMVILLALFPAAFATAAPTTDGADFNGDGRAEVGIGAPTEAIGKRLHSGATNVIYGSAAGPSAAKNDVWFQDAPGIAGGSETGDLFGSALAFGDFDGDGYADGVFGAPGEAIGASELAGAVSVIYGSPSGLTSSRNRIFYQGSSGVPGRSEAGDGFGSSVEAGDFNDDGKSDLAIGVPGERVDGGTGISNGAVVVLYGSAAGVTTTDSQVWDQSVMGVADDPETDSFGAALAVGDINGDGTADLAIGVPGETPAGDASTTETGAVQILRGSPVGLTAVGSQLVAPTNLAAFSTTGFGSAIALGDFDGDGDEDLAIGDHLYSGRVSVGGAVMTFMGSATGIDTGTERLIEQGVGGVADTTEPSDNFGFSVASGDFNDDGRADLAIGSPHEDIGAVVSAGIVNVLYGSASGLSGANDQVFRQGGGVVGNPEKDDRFGLSVATGDYNGDGATDLSVGVPSEDLGSLANAGCVNVIFGTSTPTGLTSANNRFWTQDSSGIGGSAEKNDRFGSALL